VQVHLRVDAIINKLLWRLDWVLNSPEELKMHVDNNPCEDSEYSYVEPPAMVRDTIVCPESGPVTIRFDEFWSAGEVGAGLAAARASLIAWGACQHGRRRWGDAPAWLIDHPAATWVCDWPRCTADGRRVRDRVPWMALALLAPRR
jgi:hypothetical protein